jgi:hypothetical protein
MNRPIKFRVWDFTIERFDTEIYQAGEQFGHPSSCDWMAQQYTGCHDSANKEIYEGDIVEWGKLKYLVEWNDIAYKWQGRCPYYHSYHHPTTENFRDLMNGVIVGNIFETPELLK